MMKTKIAVILLILVSTITNCDKDDKTTGPSKADFYMYGLLGVSEHYSVPDSNYYWAYARVFNHSDHRNLSAQLMYGENMIPLQERYRDSEKFFTDAGEGFMFNLGGDYIFQLQDGPKSYGGTITTLPRVEILQDTVVANTLMLEWSNVGADFYDVEFYNYGDFEKHYQVDGTSFSIHLDSLISYNFSGWIDISVAGFKGFNPFTSANGNVSGCYGYLFGYTRDDVEFNYPNLSFRKPKPKQNPPNIDKFVLSMVNSKSNPLIQTGTAKLYFTFTYARISNAYYDQSGYNYFNSVTLFEPLNSLTDFHGYLDGEELEFSDWGAFYYALRKWGTVYEDYNRYQPFTFKLDIMNQLDSATVMNPDTFSITSSPPENQIPQPPFTITWRNPNNAHFFLVNANWYIENSDLSENIMYSTTDNFFTFTEIPENVESGQIYVIAVNGSSPIHSLNPNMQKFNGYYYSSRESANDLYFSDVPDLTKSRLKELRTETNKLTKVNLDEYLLGKISERNPRLIKYKNRIMKLLKEK